MFMVYPTSKIYIRVYYIVFLYEKKGDVPTKQKIPSII